MGSNLLFFWGGGGTHPLGESEFTSNFVRKILKKFHQGGPCAEVGGSGASFGHPEGQAVRAVEHHGAGPSDAPGGATPDPGPEQPLRHTAPTVRTAESGGAEFCKNCSSRTTATTAAEIRGGQQQQRGPVRQLDEG